MRWVMFEEEGTTKEAEPETLSHLQYSYEMLLASAIPIDI